MCFIDLEKALDLVQLKDVTHLLYNSRVLYELIKLIKNIMVNRELTDPISGRERQDDFLSPLLFSMIVDEIIT